MQRVNELNIHAAQRCLCILNEFISQGGMGGHLYLFVFLFWGNKVLIFPGEIVTLFSALRLSILIPTSQRSLFWPKLLMPFWTVNVQGFPTVLVISRGQALTTKEPFARCGDKVLSLKCWLSWAGGGKINGHQPRGKSGLRVLRALVGETVPQWKREHTLRPSIHPMARHPAEHVWVPCSGPTANLYLYTVAIESRPTHHTFYRIL